MYYAFPPPFLFVFMLLHRVFIHLIFARSLSSITINRILFMAPIPSVSAGVPKALPNFLAVLVTHAARALCVPSDSGWYNKIDDLKIQHCWICSPPHTASAQWDGKCENSEKRSPYSVQFSSVQFWRFVCVTRKIHRYFAQRHIFLQNHTLTNIEELFEQIN